MGTSHLQHASGAPTTLWSFAGDWALTREVRHRGGGVDRMTGICSFRKSGAQLIQQETGWLETAGGRFQATRTYIWAEANGQLDVFFDDMRPFHSIPLGVSAPETVHLCPPDRYQVRYDFSDWPNWQSVWTVEGPRKAYRMESRFTPQLAIAETAVHNAPNR